jgi:hypothetical protein
VTEPIQITKPGFDPERFEESFHAQLASLHQQLGARSAALLLADGPSGELEIRFAHGLSQNFINRFHRTAKSGLLSEVVFGGKAVLVSDTSAAN